MRPFRHDMPFGAAVTPAGVRFGLWAPDCKSVALRLGLGEGAREIPVSRDSNGWCETVVAEAGAGTRYAYRIDGGLVVPDPASRFQPDDIHGASEVIDPLAYRWQTPDWRGRPWEETVLYELHVGTFTEAGTYRGVIERLDDLVALGVTAIELMPLADFPGARDWGYNGALLYAPDARYGRPEDLKALIDAAHAKGLMVFLDVVYNHFGPEGNYLHCFAKRFFDEARHTPWGAAIAFDGADSQWIRAFFINNALFWLNEYRCDGLRLDAVHAIEDDSPRHILDELAERVAAEVDPERHVHLVLENDRNQARFLAGPTAERKGAYVAQWNDDIHHAFHVLLSGEREGYYIDYADDPGRHLARCLAEGFAYQGDPSRFRDGERRGNPSRHLPPTAFVAFLQNHDQVGNRAFGDRLASMVPAAGVMAAAAVLLLAPQVPLLFMGEEWAAPEPFLFFCDFGDDQRDAVREGRRKEFASFEAFVDPRAREAIPDPMLEETFRRSVLDWTRRSEPKHAAMLAHYRRLLELRRRWIVPSLNGIAGNAGSIRGQKGRALVVEWRMSDASVLGLAANLGDRPVPPPAPLPGGETIYETPSARQDELPAWSVRWSLVQSAIAKGS